MQSSNHRTKITKSGNLSVELDDQQASDFHRELMNLIASHRRAAGCEDLECNADGQVISEVAHYLSAVVANDIEMALTVYVHKPADGSEQITGKAIAMFRPDNLMELISRVEEICNSVVIQVMPQIIAERIMNADHDADEGCPDDREGELH